MTAALEARVARLPTRLLELLVRWTHGEGDLERRMEMILPRNRSVPARLSFAQERLWFLDQLQPGNVAYNLPLVVPLADPVDVAALRSALAALIARHEPLRTVFAVVAGVPVQRILEDPPVALVEIDLRGRGDAHAEAERALRAEVMTPFDLERGPLLRATLIRRAPGDAFLLANMHHIVSDGWSFGVFTRELLALYDAFAHDRPLQLAELAIQYADFAVWQRDWLHGDTLAHQVEFWKQRLAGSPRLLELPTDRPRPVIESHQGAYQIMVVPARVAIPLRELARAHEATLFMVMLAGFAAVLSRYADSDDLVVGSPIANRNRHELEGLIGFFVNMLAMRIQVSDTASFADLIDRVRDTALGAYEHQDVPFEKLVEDLRLRRSLGHSPVFQVAFVLQNTPDAANAGQVGEPRELGWREDPEIALGSAKCDLTLSLAERGDALVGTCEYRTELFSHRAVARLLRRYVAALEALGRAPERLLADHSLHLRDEPAAYPAHGPMAPPGRAAAALLGLHPGARLAVLDEDQALRRLGQLACAASSAALDLAGPARLRDATHVLGSPRALAALADDAIAPGAVIAIAGLPCFDVVWKRWATHRVVGWWGLADAPCCAHLVLDGPQATIGAPIDGVAFEILDPRGRSQPVDLYGELHVRLEGGPRRATGLRARRRDDGAIELAGCAARMVRIDGTRVDPGWLEALLEQHPAIAGASVRVRGDGDDACLVSAVEARDGRLLDEGALVRFAAERLPAGLVPRRIALDGVLPAGELDADETDRASGPRTPVEAVIARIWADVLRRPVADIHGNFFDLGGSSLSSVQVLSRIRERLGIELPLHRLFEAPTVAELSRIVEADPALGAVDPEAAPAHEVEPALRRTLSTLDIDTEGLSPEQILDLVHTLEDWEVDALLDELVRHQA